MASYDLALKVINTTSVILYWSPGFKRRGHRSSILDEGSVKEFVTMFENHPTFENKGITWFISISINYLVVFPSRTREMVLKANENLSREACNFCYRSLWLKRKSLSFLCLELYNI